MKKCLLILLGALMSCSAFARIHYGTDPFTEVLLPTDDPVVIESHGLQNEVWHCWLQSSGDDIPVTINTSNYKPSSYRPYSTPAGHYFIKHPAINSMFFVGTRINNNIKFAKFSITNEDYAYSRISNAVLLISCQVRYLNSKEVKE